jgi:hypothetical protein
VFDIGELAVGKGDDRSVVINEFFYRGRKGRLAYGLQRDEQVRSGKENYFHTSNICAAIRLPKFIFANPKNK